MYIQIWRKRTRARGCGRVVEGVRVGVGIVTLAFARNIIFLEVFKVIGMNSTVGSLHCMQYCDLRELNGTIYSLCLLIA